MKKYNDMDNWGLHNEFEIQFKMEVPEYYTKKMIIESLISGKIIK